MPLADRAIHGLLRDQVLRPGIIERALDIAIEARGKDSGDARQEGRLTVRLEQLSRELENVTNMAASGGVVPAILEALIKKDDERQRVEREIAGLQAHTVADVSPRALQRQLRGFLDNWSGLLTENVVEARPLLSLVLAGNRITFEPMRDGYELQVPIAFDRMLAAVVPGLSRLQDEVASPTGFVARCGSLTFTGMAPRWWGNRHGASRAVR